MFRCGRQTGAQGDIKKEMFELGLRTSGFTRRGVEGKAFQAEEPESAKPGGVKGMECSGSSGQAISGGAGVELGENSRGCEVREHLGRPRE